MPRIALELQAFEVCNALRAGSKHDVGTSSIHFVETLQTQGPAVLVAGHHAGDPTAQRVLAMVLHLDQIDAVDSPHEVAWLVVEVHLPTEPAGIVIGHGDIVIGR